MQVFVLGEAYKPGAYLISALSTITHAIKSAGGVSDIASLRNIQLKRDGKTIAKLDLYELLLFGNIKSDIRLKPADVIYIPTVGDTVSLAGEVKRPAIYELKGETTAKELISLGGGLSPKAFASSARIERVEADGFMTVIDLDLSKKSGRMVKIQSGDLLKVDSVVANKKSIVSLLGYIHHTVENSWTEGLKLGDIVTTKSQFPSQLDLNYGLIAREVEELGELSFLSFKPGNVLSKTENDVSILLSPRDQIYFFARSYIDEDKDGEEQKSEKTRQFHLDPLLQRLRSEATLGFPAKIVEIKGDVKIPGFYPLTPDMTLIALVEAAGGFKESAYQVTAEIVRKDETNNNQSKLTTSIISLADSHSLKAKDSVFIKAKPYYSKKNIVTLGGEVMFPGEYTFARGDKLSDLIERAGGFTAVADVNAAIFTRQKLKDKQQQELERLRKRITDELISQSLVASSKSEKTSSQQQLLTEEILAKLKIFEATGRLVIPLQDILAGKAGDVILETGDTLLIPQFRQEVSVVGEVQRPSSYFYDKRLSYKDYIRQSGGFLQSANKKGVYIVKASGEVIMPRSQFLFLPKPGIKVVAGDTIVVPLDTNEKPVRGVKLLTEISQILYQLSLGAAAINSLNN
jgi:protein involved in polysaccharide export with SLBB domain